MMFVVIAICACAFWNADASIFYLKRTSAMCDVQEELQAVAQPRSSPRLAVGLFRYVLCIVFVFSVGRSCMKCERVAVTTARTKDPFCKSVLRPKQVSVH